MVATLVAVAAFFPGELRGILAKCRGLSNAIMERLLAADEARVNAWQEMVVCLTVAKCADTLV